jgi:DNA-binding CsgD family transcriptional regulator
MTTMGENDFRILSEDRYRLDVPDCGICLEIDHIRRERHQLVGELLVRCSLPGSATVDGVLAIGEMNLSSVRAREDRARYLVRRAKTDGEVDWLGLVEELAQRVLVAERTGSPSVDLRSIPRPKPDDVLTVDGFTLPRRHSSILFGDGGTAKSYFELYVLGRLALEGLRVALFDWELCGEDHRDRLERLFGDKMPSIRYARCERPLVSEVDRLRRIVRDEEIEFSGFDSIAFACDGPPEAAEVAGRYFRAVREIGGGSLHVAHVNRSETSDQKPFGSTFWHNGARSTWFAKLAESTPDGRTIHLGLYNRKANLGPLRSAVGFEIGFTDNWTAFRRIDLANAPDLAAKLTIRQRIASALRLGSMTAERLADELDADPESVKRTLRRHRAQFVVLPGGYYGLAQGDT